MSKPKVSAGFKDAPAFKVVGRFDPKALKTSTAIPQTPTDVPPDRPGATR